LRTLRVLGYVAAVVAMLALALGYGRQPSPGPSYYLVAAGIVFLCLFAAVMSWRSGGKADRLLSTWVTLMVIAAVQLTGGSDGYLYPVYFFLLGWFALPSVGGSAAEFGLAIGMVEALSLLLNEQGSILQVLLNNLPRALAAFAPPAVYGIFAEMLTESESDRDGERRPPPKAEAQRTTPHREESLLVETARGMLPLLHRHSGAQASCLFCRHDDHLMRLDDYIGGRGRIAGRALVKTTHPLLARAAGGATLINGYRPGPGGAPPWYQSAMTPSNFAVAPIKVGGTLEGIFLLDRDGSQFEMDVLEDLRDASEAVVASTTESPAVEGPGLSPDWFDRVLSATARENNLQKVVHRSVMGLHGLFPDRTVTVALREDDGSRMRVYESMGNFARGRSWRVFDTAGGVAGWVMRYEKPMRRNRMALGDKGVRSLSEEDDPDREIGSCAAAPLLVRNRVVGVMLMESESSEGFGAMHEHVLRGCAALLSLAMERLVLEDRRRKTTGTDGVTGLPRITHFEERLEESIVDVRRFGRSVAVMVVDIDGFGGMNRKLGFETGDKILRATTARLRKLLGNEAYMARTGADSFSILIRGADGAAVEAIAESVSSSFAGRPLELNGIEVSLTVSIGACATHTDRRVPMLRSRARELLEQARSVGEGRCVVSELPAVSLRE
jgi:diguanylate cyclase (GGDEF)-like protein